MRRNIFIVSKGDIVYGNTAAATRMKNYAKALSEKNFVYILSFDKLTESSKFRETEKNIFTIQENKKENIKIYDIASIVKSVVIFNKLYNEVPGNSYIIYYPNTNTILFDIILLLLHRKHLFAEINEVRRYSSEGISNFVSKIKLQIYSIIYESTFKYYRGIIYISKNIQSYYNNKNNNSIIIPILSDIDNANLSLKKISTVENEITFVFTGTVSFAKENLEELIKGFSMFNKISNRGKLLFYGPMTKNNKRKLTNLISELNLYNIVEYKGNLMRKDVKNVLENSDCLLLPRSNNKQNYYGFSTKLAEYAISGTPMILTNTGVIGDYFKDRENCLLCEGYDRHDFYEKFLEFISLNENEKKRISNNALKTARIHFDYRNYSTILDSFIH